MIRYLYPLVCLFILVASPSMAMEYIMTTLDVQSSRTMINSAHRNIKANLCQEVYSHTGGRTDLPSEVVVDQTASFSVHYGKVDPSRRGTKHHRTELARFKEYAASLLARTLSDWRASGHYAAKAIEAVYNRHIQLSEYRLKWISVESVGHQGPREQLRPEGVEVDSRIPPAELFSALRIYDSSPVMKALGREYKVPRLGESDTKEIAEMVFKNFNLETALNEVGIPRARFTWSLGLFDVSGKQQEALKVLFSRTADLLDLHYNQRDYMNLNRINEIKRDDVDIVFYGAEALIPYYMKTLDINPLLRSDGHPVVLEKNSSRYYVFHIKGSSFIKQFFNIRYHQPLFGNNNGLRREQKILDGIRQPIIREFDKLDPENFKVDNMVEFVIKLEPIVYDFFRFMENQNGPYDLAEIMARFMMLRRQLPNDIFSESDPKGFQKQALEIIKERMLQQSPDQTLDVPSMLFTLGVLETALRDPMTFMLNNAVEKT